VLKKKKHQPVSDLEFEVTAVPIKKKKKVNSSPKERAGAEPFEDLAAVDAAKDKLRRIKNKNKKAPRAPRNVEEAEVVELKKKKIKPKQKDAMDLVPVDGPQIRRISKLNKKELVSIIGDDAEEMQALFEVGATDQAVQLLNRRLIQTCIDLIPQLETGIRSSNGRYGVHSLNGTIQTIRELMIDLQSMQDRGAIGQSIVAQVLQPIFLELATKVVEEQATVSSEVKDLLPQDVYMKLRQAQIDSRNRLGTFMNSKFEQMRDQTIQFLQR
jgi:hypothetical protein